MASMHCQLPPATRRSELDELLDFKHLAASEGMNLDISRLLRDVHYAEHCLIAARRSPSELLRRCAEVTLTTLW